MNELLATLCDLLDEELERQENILAVCRAQGKAAQGRNVADLESKTAALNALISEAGAVERTRSKLMLQTVEAFGLPPERQTLTHLIEVAPEPWKSRLKHFQERLRSTLHQTSRVVRGNSLLFRRSLNAIGKAFRMLRQCFPAAPSSYDVRGGEIAGRQLGPAVIDQRG